MVLLDLRDFSVCDAREVALGEGTCVLRSVELGGIDRAAEVGHEHPVARNVQRDADAFHQVREHDLGRGCGRIDGGAVDRVAARRVAAVSPVQERGA